MEEKYPRRNITHRSQSPSRKETRASPSFLGNTTPHTHAPIRKRKAVSSPSSNLSSSKSASTPRTKHTNSFFKDQQIPLLNYLHNKNDKSVMFQVQFKTPEQFTKYVNLRDADDTAHELKDCIYASLFSLGLIRTKAAKKYSKNNKPVEILKFRRYLSHVFDLHDSEHISTFEHNFPTPKNKQLKNYGCYSGIVTILSKQLKSGYATAIILFYNDNGKNRIHMIVAYRYLEFMYFFDPQYSNEGVVDTQGLMNMFDGYNIDTMMTFEISGLNPDKIYAFNRKCQLPAFDLATNFSEIPFLEKSPPKKSVSIPSRKTRKNNSKHKNY